MANNIVREHSWVQSHKKTQHLENQVSYHSSKENNCDGTGDHYCIPPQLSMPWPSKLHTHHIEVITGNNHHEGVMWFYDYIWQWRILDIIIHPQCKNIIPWKNAPRIKENAILSTRAYIITSKNSGVTHVDPHRLSMNKAPNSNVEWSSNTGDK